jgi:spore photoproduct lyase
MLTDTTSPELLQETGIAPPRNWLPRRVVFTPAALAEAYGRAIRERVEALNLPVQVLPANRLTGLRGFDERETYRVAKSTLAVVTAPAGAFRLQPIPPSADWQFHLAEGCPAHCQYCYLAGSLSGPPVVRVFANLPAILDNLARYIHADRPETSFEVSCYTDPLGIEHLTGSLAECIRWFGARPPGDGARLRWVSKFDAVDGLLALRHEGRTRCRASVNAQTISRRLEGGTAAVPARLAALGRLAREAGYPIGLVIAPIMPIEGWEEEYGTLLAHAARALQGARDITVELITHRFTPGSKEVLQGWYPNTSLDLSEEDRVRKFNKFGGVKYVYPRDMMQTLRSFFEREIAAKLPSARVLYWT